MIPEPLEAALALPNGARFYRCALQVNPFSYLKRHSEASAFADEAAYNSAIIEACTEEGIEVIGVADHFEVETSRGLIEDATAVGIIVFPGFEAETKDGVHFLCLFDPGTDLRNIQRVIDNCWLWTNGHTVPGIGRFDAEELPRECRRWGAVCVSAHTTLEKGLLKVLKGQSRVVAWRNPDLTACSLPGSVKESPEEYRLILQNKNKEYERDRLPAYLNSQDVCGPEDLRKPGCSCWIKMSEVSVEGLRQAFLDPDSRIRLASDPAPEAHAEFKAIAWQGGFLDGQAIHFNENVNVLIGGRGTGKSTIVESIRYALQMEPVGDDAREAHEGIIREVLGSGAKIHMLVRSCRPDVRDYVIERTIPNPPVVKNVSGEVLPLTPRDVLPRVEVYGQHEIAELAQDQEKRTRLLDRFGAYDPALQQRKADIKRELERSRKQILDSRAELQRVEERLAMLPVLENTLERYRQAGLEERLKEQSLLVREERVLRTADERLQPFREVLSELQGSLPIDRAFVSDRALEDLPGRDILRRIDDALLAFEHGVAKAAHDLRASIEEAERAFAEIRVLWEDRKKKAQAEYERVLRELHRDRIDGEEFLRLRRQLEDLGPLKERRHALQTRIAELEGKRQKLLNEWADARRHEFASLEKAAKRVNCRLAGRVQVEVKFEGNRRPLMDHLRRIQGRIGESLDILEKRDGLSLLELVAAMRAGRDELVRVFALPRAQAERLAQAGDAFVMEMEELDLPSTTSIKLNVAREGRPPEWKTLEQLSKGQKATAILLILLLESDAPLVVDQPEDDLDNRFVTDGVIPKLREEKRRRQFVFATHNANIPVLGDAELIVGVSATGEADTGRAEIPPEHVGSIDRGSVRVLVEEILEGGKDAFETRRQKYGF